MSESILNTLKEEHRHIQILLTQIEYCHNNERKQELFEELKEELIPHMEGEEATIYAKLHEVYDDAAVEISEIAMREHNDMKKSLSKLETLTCDSKEWRDEFDHLRDSVLKHIKEEESDLFSEAREDFTRSELAQFTSEFEEAKNQSHH